MSDSLHIANLKAIPLVCSSANDWNFGVCETADMAKAKNPTKERIKNYVKAWREFREMTGEQLAEAVGTDKSQISQLEGEGKEFRKLTHGWAKRLAKPLRCDPSYLFERHPDTVPIEILDIWDNIADKDKPTAKRVLESFIKPK